jgi:hypothetical protein
LNPAKIAPFINEIPVNHRIFTDKREQNKASDSGSNKYKGTNRVEIKFHTPNKEQSSLNNN